MTYSLPLFIDERDPSVVYDELYTKEDDPWGHVGKNSSHHIDRNMMYAALQGLASKCNPELSKKPLLLEVGCGLGQNINALEQTGFNIIGTDVSEVAISRALANNPMSSFIRWDITSSETSILLSDIRPHVIYLCHVTWCILNSIDSVLDAVRLYAKNSSHDVYLAHLTAIYPPGMQQFGADKFTDSESIANYFSLESLVFHGEIWPKPDSGSAMLIGKV